MFVIGVKEDRVGEGIIVCARSKSEKVEREKGCTHGLNMLYAARKKVGANCARARDISPKFAVDRFMDDYVEIYVIRRVCVQMYVIISMMNCASDFSLGFVFRFEIKMKFCVIRYCKNF